MYHPVPQLCVRSKSSSGKNVVLCHGGGRAYCENQRRCHGAEYQTFKPHVVLLLILLAQGESGQMILAETTLILRPTNPPGGLAQGLTPSNSFVE
jgi:hypothetical protein